jgi:hypothetical protein
VIGSTNARRRGADNHIRDNDLITARDCRKIVQAAIQLYDNERAEAERLAAGQAASLAEFHRNNKWYRRAYRWVVGR